MCGIAVADAALAEPQRALERRCAGPRSRSMPAMGLTLYFTYSRGGLLALAIGALCMLALSRDRLWMLATLAIAGLGALPALLAIPGYRSLADDVASQTSVDQGVTVLLILLAGTAVSLALFALLRRLEDARRRRAPGARSRSPATRRCSKAPALAPRRRRGRRRDRLRRPRLGSVLQLRPRLPHQPGPAFLRPLQRRPRTTSGGSRSTPSKKSRCSATAPAPTSSPGSGCARST